MRGCSSRHVTHWYDRHACPLCVLLTRADARLRRVRGDPHERPLPEDVRHRAQGVDEDAVQDVFPRGEVPPSLACSVVRWRGMMWSDTHLYTHNNPRNGLLPRDALRRFVFVEWRGLNHTRARHDLRIGVPFLARTAPHDPWCDDDGGPSRCMTNRLICHVFVSSVSPPRVRPLGELGDRGHGAHGELRRGHPQHDRRRQGAQLDDRDQGTH